MYICNIKYFTALLLNIVFTPGVIESRYETTVRTISAFFTCWWCGYSQGDQVGRIFAYCAIAFSGKFFWKLKRRSKFVPSMLFSWTKLCGINFVKLELGHILGDYFTNSPGHPGTGRKTWSKSRNVLSSPVIRGSQASDCRNRQTRVRLQNQL
jgi:hypothetical protein